MLDIPNYIVELYEKGELATSDYAHTHNAKLLLGMRDRLLELRDGSAVKKNDGICYYIALHLPQRFFETWPLWSGCPMHPVPHPTLRSGTAFRTQPKWEGTYGRNRFSLVEHLLVLTEHYN